MTIEHLPNYELLPELERIAKAVNELSEDLASDLDFAIEVIKTHGAAPSEGMKAITAEHCIITYQCRNNRGPMGAFDEAVDRCRKEYNASLLANFNDDFHLVLTVEKK